MHQNIPNCANHDTNRHETKHSKQMHHIFPNRDRRHRRPDTDQTLCRSIPWHLPPLGRCQSPCARKLRRTRPLGVGLKRGPPLASNTCCVVLIAVWLPQPVDKVVAGVDLTLHAGDNREGILHEGEGLTTKAIWSSSSVTVSMSMSTIVAPGALGPSMTRKVRSVLFPVVGLEPGVFTPQTAALLRQTLPCPVKYLCHGHRQARASHVLPASASLE